MDLLNPFKESIEFFNSIRKDLDQEFLSKEEIFFSKSEEILSIYRYFALYLLFYESGDTKHHKIIEKIENLDDCDSEEQIYKAGYVEEIDAEDLIPYFQKIISPDYNPPKEPIELANTLLAFFVFYRDIPEKLSGDLTTLLHIVDRGLTRTVARAFAIMSKITWFDLKERFRQKEAKEGRREGISKRKERMKEIWKEIPDREKKRDYTIANEMKRLWRWDRVPPDLKTFVKYIRQFREKN